MLKRVMEEGIEATPRGRKTRELLHQVTLLPDPRKRVLTIGNRRANPFFQIAETVWILAGASDAEWILHFNKQLGAFLDEYETGPGWAAGDLRKYKHFHAPYGERMRHYGFNAKMHLGWPEQGVDQLTSVIQELTQDPESRRAVMVYGNPIFDRPHFRTNDRPCNVAFAFKLRDGKLHMTTFNRSNDVILGLTFTNIAQFTTIQEVVAASLGVELGPYLHYSDSLHVYLDDADKVVTWLQDNSQFDIYQYVPPTPMMKDPFAYKAAEDLYKAVDRDGEDYALVACPYWRSAALMIQAWDALQAWGPDRPYAHVDALDRVAEVPAEDWRAACLEFLFRWAQNREREAKMGPQEFGRYMAYIREAADIYAMPVINWIFHSK
jgi:thymidylate synthase